MPHGGIPGKNKNEKTAQKSLDVEQSSSDEESSVQMHILMELKQVNLCLDTVDVRDGRQQEYLKMKFEQSPLGTFSSGPYSLKHSKCVISSSDSVVSGGNMLSLSPLRSSAQT